MKNALKKIVWLVIAAPVVYLAFVWAQLPEKIAMQFDLHGNPTRYDTKIALIWLVVLNVGVYLLITNIYRIDPKKYAAENKDRLSRIAFAVAVFMSALQFLSIYTNTNESVQLNMNLLFPALGILFAVIGNYLPNLKPNYFAGLRLPWTLENEENWRKTHALAGKLWFTGGLVLAVTCLFTPARLSMIFFFLVMFVIVMIPIVYSYLLFKKHKPIN